MDQSSTLPKVDATAVRRAKDADNRLAALTSLLESIDDPTRAGVLAAAPQGSQYESKLASSRLGIASSLFVALRAKHAPTAAHSLRVALGLSSWGSAAGLVDDERDALEVAALLHDIGKIGVPDHVLLKPGRLAGEELLMMERHRQLGRDMLTACCSSSQVLEIVHYSPAWFDGSKHGFDRSGGQLPRGARMLAIVDAFDAMTTDHAYRRALSRERALAELFEFSDTQFDGLLVKEFAALIGKDKVQFSADVTRRWLQHIQAHASNRFWGLSENPRPVSAAGVSEPDLPFHDRLLESMHDGVIFVDQNACITLWNRSAERLTGISAQGIHGTRWLPGLVRMRDDHGKVIPDDECPVLHTMDTGSQSFRRISVMGRSAERVSVDIHITPVLGSDGVVRGATVILHDASSQVTLEERVQTLHERATRDPLTKLSNRAEFDRMLPLFVKTHLDQNAPCSMIICDIDHFKKINDTHGHQAGDEALVTFASLLQRSARTGDLVARYGGEEFVILCADCDNATATRRAEVIRQQIAAQPHKCLANKCFTASFGVTEIQGGDNPENFLRRADRALLQAKDNGRNLVVQLGTGIGDDGRRRKSGGWFHWFAAAPLEHLVSRQLVTVVPLKVAAEKMRGFVADHHAQVVEIEGNRVVLRIDGQDTPLTRRWNDRAVSFLIELTFEESVEPCNNKKAAAQSRTVIQVVVRPKRQRDRRRRDAVERARQLLLSLKSYLMASDFNGTFSTESGGDKRETFLLKSKQVLSQWLGA